MRKKSFILLMALIVLCAMMAGGAWGATTPFEYNSNAYATNIKSYSGAALRNNAEDPEQETYFIKSLTTKAYYYKTIPSSLKIGIDLIGFGTTESSGYYGAVCGQTIIPGDKDQHPKTGELYNNNQYLKEKSDGGAGRIVFDIPDPSSNNFNLRFRQYMQNGTSKNKTTSNEAVLTVHPVKVDIVMGDHADSTTSRQAISFKPGTSGNAEVFLNAVPHGARVQAIKDGNVKFAPTGQSETTITSSSMSLFSGALTATYKDGKITLNYIGSQNAGSGLIKLYGKADGSIKIGKATIAGTEGDDILLAELPVNISQYTPPSNKIDWNGTGPVVIPIGGMSENDITPGGSISIGGIPLPIPGKAQIEKTDDGIKITIPEEVMKEITDGQTEPELDREVTITDKSGNPVIVTVTTKPGGGSDDPSDPSKDDNNTQGGTTPGDLQELIDKPGNEAAKDYMDQKIKEGQDGNFIIKIDPETGKINEIGNKVFGGDTDITISPTNAGKMKIALISLKDGAYVKNDSITFPVRVVINGPVADKGDDTGNPARSIEPAVTSHFNLTPNDGTITADDAPDGIFNFTIRPIEGTTEDGYYIVRLLSNTGTELTWSWIKVIDGKLIRDGSSSGGICGTGAAVLALGALLLRKRK